MRARKLASYSTVYSGSNGEWLVLLVEAAAAATPAASTEGKLVPVVEFSYPPVRVAGDLREYRPKGN